MWRSEISIRRCETGCLQTSTHSRLTCYTRPLDGQKNWNRTTKDKYWNQTYLIHAYTWWTECGSVSNTVFTRIQKTTCLLFISKMSVLSTQKRKITHKSTCTQTGAGKRVRGLCVSTVSEVEDWGLRLLLLQAADLGNRCQNTHTCRESILRGLSSVDTISVTGGKRMGVYSGNLRARDTGHS